MKMWKIFFLSAVLISTMLFLGCKDTEDTEQASGDSVPYINCDICHSGKLYKHYDDPLTKEIEGYNIAGVDSAGKFTDASTCGNCHDIVNHSDRGIDLTINRQWAESGHGNLDGEAWKHYDWDMSAADASDRTDCQECHTATGFANFASAPASYSSSNNVFTYLTGEQNEVLYCTACHTDGKGTLRAPGIITKDYSPTSGTETKETYVDAGISNLCINCHSLRKIGKTIKNDDSADLLTSNFSGMNSHYMGAAAIVYTKAGYEYTDKTYSTSPHASLGSSSAGPCVTCHMNKKDHTFHASNFDSVTGKIISITAYSDSGCGCHSGKDATSFGTEAETSHAGYKAALKSLYNQLKAKGIFWYVGYPYYYKVAISSDGSEAKFSNWYATWADKDTLGAAFNYNMLMNESGAFVHNPKYTKQLIYDSIDFLDNGALDDTVNATLTTASEDDAASYLGSSRP